MAKLPRYTQQVFASSAPSNEIATFGSFAAGSPARFSGSTITPALVQALSNYLVGWSSAVIGNDSPLIQDMEAICYLFAYQLAYLMQEGIPEYDSGTTYFIGSLCLSNGIIYASLVDNNIGNDPTTDVVNWEQQNQPIGISDNSLPFTQTVATGKTGFVPNLTVPVGETLTFDTGSNLVGVNSIIVLGTLIMAGTSTGRIL